MAVTNKDPSSIFSIYKSKRDSCVISKILNSFFTFSFFLSSSLSSSSFSSSASTTTRDALNRLYLSNSILVIGLIWVFAIKFVLGITILKPNTE